VTPVALVLASGSPTRRAMLANAGVPVAAVDVPDVDEPAVRRTLTDSGATTEHAAMTLAEQKARAVARSRPGALVLGADQMLETPDGAWLDKPSDRTVARAQLIGLRGTTHRLVSAAVLVRDSALVWEGSDSARLTMRAFSDVFLDTYLDTVGDDVTGTVGGYRLEGPGVQLFSCVEGDVFTVLGLPLLPLLEALRTLGVSQT